MSDGRAGSSTILSYSVGKASAIEPYQCWKIFETPSGMMWLLFKIFPSKSPHRRFGVALLRRQCRCVVARLSPVWRESVASLSRGRRITGASLPLHRRKACKHTLVSQQSQRSRLSGDGHGAFATLQEPRHPGRGAGVCWEAGVGQEALGWRVRPGGPRHCGRGDGDCVSSRSRRARDRGVTFAKLSSVCRSPRFSGACLYPTLQRRDNTAASAAIRAAWKQSGSEMGRVQHIRVEKRTVGGRDARVSGVARDGR
jgi:hypothetical protein